MKVSEYFELGLSQGELDFVDVDVTRDTRLYLDPYAIQMNSLENGDEFYTYLVSFFETLLSELRNGNRVRVRQLVRHLHEPRYTYLGQSAGLPQGLGLGRDQSQALVRSIQASTAFQTGQLSDLAEAELFVPGVGPDKLSDLTTNVLRAPLCSYTENVCLQLGIETQEVAVAPWWDKDTETWRSGYKNLPLVDGNPVMLIPKILVRQRLCLDSRAFYETYINYLQAELEISESLTSALRGASGIVTKSNVKDVNPFDKEELARFSRDHPDQFANFKRIAETAGPISDNDIDPDFFYTAVAQELIRELRNMPTGRPDADSYERLVSRAVTLLFWPHLTFPIAQRPIHNGRKRVDIEYTNYAKSGLLYTLRTDPVVLSRVVPIECKNYSSDIANEEFDQLIGRFSDHRGKLGLLFYRNANDRDAIVERQQMALIDSRYIVIAINDDELIEMLEATRLERDEFLDNFLNRKYRQLIAFNNNQ